MRLFKITEEELNEVQDLRKKVNPLTIMAAPRLNRGSLHTPKAKRYADYKFAIKHLAAVKLFNLPEIPVHIRFTLSTDKKERLCQPAQIVIYGKPMGINRHQIKPDVDNLVKGFFDALKARDQTINFMIASKVWGTEGCIEVFSLSEDVLHELYNPS